jgi:hypothetical protein
MGSICRVTLVAVLSLGASADAATVLSVGPSRDAMRGVILEAEVPFAGPKRVPELKAETGVSVPCQLLGAAGGKARVAWRVDRLEKGATARWTLTWTDGPAAADLVRLADEADGKVRIDIGGALFTRYVHGDKEPKPYLYPIELDGLAMTRHYPMKEKVPGERYDHPHHRSFFFTHGDVNGIDFWAEGKDPGRILHREFLETESGPVLGRISARSEWIGPGGEKVLDDLRRYRFVPLGTGQVAIDFSVVLSASDGEVTFGDTKEGTFGIRVAGWMDEAGGGRIVSSRGASGEKAAWGKPAEWVDYGGTRDGKAYGVAIFDHPTSFRHPTHWHVRSYGLFAANPFGYHDFYGRKERKEKEKANEREKKEGDHTLKRGASITFRYRVIFHRGEADEVPLEELYRGFAAPPEVKVEAEE